MHKNDGYLVEVTEDDLVLLKNNPKEFWKDVSYIDYKAFSGLSLTSIIIPDTITEIGASAFEDCVNLKKVKLPKGLEKIAPYAFWGCVALDNIVIPDGVKEIYPSAFENCSCLSKVKLSKNLEKIDETAFGNTRITKIKFPKNLKSIGVSAFENCKFKSIKIPNGVKEIVLSFYNCGDLKEVSLPDTLETLGKLAFADCKKLQKITIPQSVKKIEERAFIRSGINKIDILGGVEEIGVKAFDYCMQLQSINLPDSIKTINDQAFEHCTSLKDITLPKNLETIGMGSFMNCGVEKIVFPPSLKMIGYNAFRESGLQEITIQGEVDVDSRAFRDCYKLKKVTILNGVVLQNEAFLGCNLDELIIDLKSFNREAFGRATIKKLTILDGPTTIDSEQLRGVEDIEEIVLPNSVKDISFFGFAYCSDLKNITLSENIECLGDKAFYVCGALKSITFSPKLMYIGCECFSGCSSLTELTIPESVDTIREKAFMDCKNLKSVSLPQALTEISEKTFSRCYALENVDLPKNLEKIGDYAFYTCRALSSVELPDGLKEIGDVAFQQTILTKIEIPNSVEKIGAGCFAECRFLTEVNLSNNIKVIPDSAFGCCTSLQSVTIPEGVKEIHRDAFAGCSNLSEITLPNSITKIDSCAFEGTKITYLKLNRHQVDIGEKAFFLTGIKYVTIVGDEIIFSKNPAKDGTSIPYEIYDALNSYGLLDYFINNCSMKAFTNEMKPWQKQIDSELKLRERRSLYLLAYSLGCFSNDKMRDSKGKELEVTKAQKRSSLLASIINSGALSFSEIGEMFQGITLTDYVSDRAVKFISSKNGKEYINITFLKELNKKFDGAMLKGFIDLENIEKKRTTSNDKTGLPEKISWEEAFVKYLIGQKYGGVTERNKDIAEVFLEKGLSEEHFRKASALRDKAIEKNVVKHVLGKEIKEKTILDQVEEVKNHTAEILQDTKQLLEDIYAQKFTYEFLDKYDPRNFIIGLYTSCCATITGTFYGAEIAKRTVLEDDVQNLVVKDESGEIIAKGTIYINFEQGYAVFNDFEINEKYKKDEQDSGYYSSSTNSQAFKDRELIFEALMRGIRAFVKEYDQMHPDKPMKQVNVGMGYNRLKAQCERYEKATKCLTVPAEYSFKDAKEEQYILYNRDSVDREVIQ